MTARSLLAVAVLGLTVCLLPAGMGVALAQPQRAGSATAGWQIAIADPDGGAGLSMVLDGAGYPHASYGGNEAGTYEYGLKYGYYDGSAWQIEMADDDIPPGWETSVALDANGEPHIAYHDPHEALKYAYYDGTLWQIGTVDSGADVGESASLELDSAGKPHIAYADETNHTVKYAHHTGISWDIQVVDSFVNPVQSISLDLALDTTNHPRLCYYDPSANALRYAYHDGSSWHFETIDSDVFYNGQHCSIALDSQDGPHVAYIDLGLWYAYRSGTSWHSTEIGDEFGLQHLSLALDRSAKPHIAYASWANYGEVLRYARFNGITWGVEDVDVAGEGSRYDEVSLALDAGQQPHIVYRDLAPDDLKYAFKALPPIVARVYLPLVERGGVSGGKTE